MATHSSILAWEISWTEELGRLWFMGSLKVGHDLPLSMHTHMHGDNHVDFCSIFYEHDVLR